jgi:hypothetical protein
VRKVSIESKATDTRSKISRRGSSVKTLPHRLERRLQTYLKHNQPTPQPGQHIRMLRPAQIQPFSPQQQRFSVFDGKRHGIPAAVVQCFDGVFAQFQEEAGPVGHLADHCESFPRGLEVVQRTYALCAEDALVPGVVRSLSAKVILKVPC